MLALYDRDERRDVDDPGMRREVEDGVVRLVDQVGTDSMVVHSHLDALGADAAIRREAAYFDRLGHNVEWKLYAHDEPQDLHERLLAQGFTAEEPDAIMALDLSQVPPALLEPVPAFIRRLTDADMLKDATRVHEAVWPEKKSKLAERLAYLLRNDSARLSVYAAYMDGEPVSAARIHFSDRSAFASLWGGATLPGYRGRGLYTALLAVRLQEAKRRGARFLTIDAGPMSRPIVEKYGFRLLTFAQAHVRRIGSRSAP
ncbi:MAG: GNAT family N-acetyltransferase [Thermaerobacter sp.]|nr:GNAT family N-acetyltransferase [Thermaerobacter sp.]